MLAPSRIVVVGAGAFGRNHLRVWRELEQAGLPVTLVGAVDPDPQIAATLAAQYQIPVFSSVRDLLAGLLSFDAASVAAPTEFHEQVASQLLERGIDLLVEKPLTPTLDQADRLIALAQQRQRILQVGHLERFNPAVAAVRPLLHHPRFFEVHRLSIFTPRSLDIDVVLDLMIHDLDIVLSLVQSPVQEIHAVGLPVLSSQVDIANVRIEFQSGCVANFTASRVSTEKVRKLRFFQPNQYISIDYARQDVLLVDLAPGTPSPTPADCSEHAIPFAPAEQRHPTPGLVLRKLAVPPGEPLRLELESFLRAVRERLVPQVSAQDGRAALALALDIRDAIHAHQRRAGLA